MTAAANRLPTSGTEQKRSRRTPAEKARATGTSGARQTRSVSGDRRGGTARGDTNGAVVAVDTADPPTFGESWGRLPACLASSARQAGSLPHGRHTRLAQQPLDDLVR